jgi:hypothetical protein
MDSVSAAHAASTTASTTSSTSSTTASRTADGKDFATLFADAKKDLRKGETLSKVSDHDYARIRGGTRDGECVNLSGNARSGQAFDLIWRDGRQFHVYGGSGADHKVVEVGRAASTTTSTTSTGGTDATSSTGTTDSTASTGTTSTAGTSTSAGTSTDSTTASDVSSSARS